MAVDRRESAGDFYPGGKTISTRPVATGGDVRHSDFANVETVGERFTDTTMRDKLNEVIDKLKGLGALAALLSLNALGAGISVQTAPKGQVYNDEHVVTNATWNAEGLATSEEMAAAVSNLENAVASATNGLLRTETDPTVPEWAKSATPPLPPNYNTVSNKAMTALQSFTEVDPTVPAWAKSATQPLPPNYNTVSNAALAAATNEQVITWFNSLLYNNGDIAQGSTVIDQAHEAWYAFSMLDPNTHDVIDAVEIFNALNSIPSVAQSATNYTDEAIGALPAWSTAPNKPTYTAAEVGAATAADVYRIVAGTNVVLVVTNYNSATHAPAMKLQHLDPESGQYVTYWDETRRHGMTLTNAMDYADAAVATRAPKAWSGTTSGMGVEAPAGVTWISTPETVIAGGFEYEKVITSSGAVWVLASNGLTTGATTNSFFRISASDGTELFSIEKTDSYLVGVDASGITRASDTVTIPVAVVAPTHPYIRATTNLVDAVWTKEDENGFSCPWATVSWSGTTGAYVATVTCSQPQAFFYFEYMVEGVAKIKNTAKTEMTGGIIFNGTTYMPTVNGNKLEFVAQ